jgi:hypothetical protein
VCRDRVEKEENCEELRKVKMQQKIQKLLRIKNRDECRKKEMRGTKSIIYFKNCVKDFRDFGT